MCLVCCRNCKGKLAYAGTMGWGGNKGLDADDWQLQKH